jgi:hypothetical protein
MSPVTLILRSNIALIVAEENNLFEKLSVGFFRFINCKLRNAILDIIKQKDLEQKNK